MENTTNEKAERTRTIRVLESEWEPASGDGPELNMRVRGNIEDSDPRPPSGIPVRLLSIEDRDGRVGDMPHDVIGILSHAKIFRGEDVVEGVEWAVYRPEPPNGDVLGYLPHVARIRISY